MLALVMIARRRSPEAAWPRVLPHMLLLATMWFGYLVIFTGTTGIPAASPAPAVGAMAPGPIGGAGGLAASIR
jgi:hypothetical protein